MDVNQDGVVDVADLIRLSQGSPVVEFTAASASVIERETTYNLAVRAGGGFNGPIAYEVAGSATPGIDYTALPGSVTIQNGTATIPVPILKDYLFEEQETVQITLLPGTGYRLGRASTFVLTLQDIEASFETSTVLVSEGSGTVQLPVIFNAPFKGRLVYSITGSASPALDYEPPMGGGVVVDGTRAVISLNILDDLVVEDSEIISVELAFNDAISESEIDYDLGVPERILVLIQDNDSIWTGSMMTASSEETFQMAVRTNGAETYAAIVSATDPDSDIGFVSAGTIPSGTWPASSAVLDATFLAMEFGPLPMGTLQLLGDVEMKRYLEFGVDGDLVRHLVQKTKLLGEFKSTVLPVQPGRDYLRRETVGPLLLIRGASQLPFREHEVATP